MADQVTTVNINGVGSTTIVTSARDFTNNTTVTNTTYARPTPEPVFLNVHSPEANFVGRLSELMLLENATTTSSDSSARNNLIVVSGLGGIGKTQLIRKFIEKNRTSYTNIIWINSENVVTIKDSFKNLTDILEIPTHRDGKEKDFEIIVELVVNRLSNRKTLMVYDNVDEIKNVKFLLTMVVSGTKLDVLITSRIRDWGSQINVVKLNVWEIDDAILYVATTLKNPDSSHDDSPENKKLLAQTLQAFPLALKQATAYINYQRIAGIFQIADYIKKYGTQEMLDYQLFHRDACNIYEKTTFTTWRVTIDAIEQHGAIGRLAVTILQMMAFFDPDDIYRDVFIHLTLDNEENVMNCCSTLFSRLCKRQETDDARSQFLIPVDFNNEENVILAVRLLVNYSMVDSQKQQSVLSVHRLVQQVIKLKLESTPLREKQILRDCLLLIAKLIVQHKIGASHFHAVSVLLSSLKFKDLLNEFCEMPNDILGSLIESGKYNRSKEFGDKILIALTDILGIEHPVTVLTKHKVAYSYSQLGKYTEALRMFQDVFDKQKHILGEGHPDTFTSEHNIACIYAQLGKYTVAIQMFRDVFDKRKKILGENHPDTILSEHDIAYVYGQLGRYTEALQIFQEILDKQKNFLRNDDPLILKSKLNIAHLYGQLGKYDDALQMFQEVFEKRKDILGEDHPQTLTCQLNIAYSYRQLGKYTEALQQFQDVFEKHSNILGKDHPDTLLDEHNISCLKGQLGQNTEALEMLENVCTKQKEILGENHPDTLLSEHFIADLYGQQGKYTEALQILQDVFKKRKEILGENHPNTLLSEHNIADLYAHLGKCTEALQMFQGVLEKLKDILGEDHPQTIICKHNIASKSKY